MVVAPEVGVDVVFEVYIVDVVALVQAVVLDVVKVVDLQLVNITPWLVRYQPSTSDKVTMVAY